MKRLGKLKKQRTDGEYEHARRTSLHNASHSTIKVGRAKAARKRGSKKALLT